MTKKVKNTEHLFSMFISLCIEIEKKHLLHYLSEFKIYNLNQFLCPLSRNVVVEQHVCISWNFPGYVKKLIDSML